MTNQSSAYSEIDLKNVKPVKTGKVRSIYDLGEHFLFVATDRISAYDFILPTPIADKGKVLTQISKFWFDFLSDITKVHYVSSDMNDLPIELKEYHNILDGRSMIVQKANVIPIECVVRGYISGSAWSEYKKSGTVNNEPMPTGLQESSMLENPIFTPATKAESGHDENIPFSRMCELIGDDLSIKLKNVSLAIYKKARDFMNGKGIILADTKFEFGQIDGEIVLIDEVLTPDSSRFWPKDKYQEGRGQQSFDKQYVRDYLLDIKWDKQPPVPSLPEEVVEKTREKYLEIFKIITNKQNF